MRLRSLAGWWPLCLALSFSPPVILGQDPGFRAVWDAGVDPGRDCGAYCLGRVISRMGGEVPSLDVLRKEVQVDASGVTSLENIRGALEARGIRIGLRAADVAPSGLSVAILTGDENPDVGHFVVIEPSGDTGRVAVYAPPYWVREKSWSELRPHIGPWMLLVLASEGVPAWRVRIVAVGAGFAAVGVIGWLLRSRVTANAKHN